MKRIARLLAAGVAVAIAVACGVAVAEPNDFAEHANHATPYYFGMVRRVAANSGASYSLTNDFTYPWRLAAFAGVTAPGITNTVTITHYGVISSNLYTGDVITTNDFGFVETNWNGSVTNTVGWRTTNVLYTAGWTNMPYLNLDDDSELPKYHYIQKKDVVKIEWTYTNAIFDFTLFGLR